MYASNEYTPGSGRELLSESFFQVDDVVQIARDLLGKVLLTQFDGQLCRARIVETEAYRAPDDQASHARNHTRTPRTEIMYARGGHVYVYLCYGIHHLFNVVTGPEDTAHAVLIRGIEPLANTAVMLNRRGMEKVGPQLTAGPGVLSKAMGIRTIHTGLFLPNPASPIKIESDGYLLNPDQIGVSTRVGIAYAGEWALQPWRFFIRANPFVSKAKGINAL